MQYRKLIQKPINFAPAVWKLSSCGVYRRFGNIICLQLQGKSTVFNHPRQWQRIVRKSVHVRFNGVTSLRTIVCPVTWHSRGRWSSSAHRTLCRLINNINYTLVLRFFYVIPQPLAAKVGTSKGGGKQWQTTPKNLPRMQCARAIPVTWLGSGSCQPGLQGWILMNDWILSSIPKPSVV